MNTQPTNEHSAEPGDVDSAMKDTGLGQDVATPPARQSGDAQRNPDNVKDGSAQDGTQPLAGA